MKKKQNAARTKPKPEPMKRVRLAAPPAEVEFKGLFKVRLLLGEDERKRVVPSELALVMGLDPDSLRRRVSRQFRKGCSMMELPSGRPSKGEVTMTSPSKGVAIMATPRGGGLQKTLTLDLRYLPRLLLGIEASRVRPEIRPRVEEIQDELAEALAAYTFEGIAVNPAFSPALPAVGIAAPVTLSAETIRDMSTAFQGDLRTVLREERLLEQHSTPNASKLISQIVTHAQAYPVTEEMKQAGRAMQQAFREGGEELAPGSIAAAPKPRSANTVRAYAVQWKGFTTWCAAQGFQALPASPATAAAYFAAMASGSATGRACKVNGIDLARAAIVDAHKAAGHASPCEADEVRSVLAHLRRTAAAPRQVAPLLLPDLRRILTKLPDSLTGKRDRALLVIGWLGGLRRTALVALDVPDLIFSPDGRSVKLRDAKTDPKGQGLIMPFGSSAKGCPVRALRAWLDVGRIRKGPVFRSITKHGHVSSKRLTSHAVASIVKSAVARVGLDPETFSAESLRSGLANSQPRLVLGA